MRKPPNLKTRGFKASGSKALGQRASRSKASRSKLEDFPFRVPDNVGFADLDPNDHVNNAVYFETGRVTLMKEELAWIMVRPDMHFRAQLRWPGQIGIGEIRPHVGNVRSGGVFGWKMRRLGAIGVADDS